MMFRMVPPVFPRSFGKIKNFENAAREYFDQLLQTVENETTVLNLVFKGFLQTFIPPMIPNFMQKRYYYFSVDNFLSHRTKKNRSGTLGCSRKFPVS